MNGWNSFDNLVPYGKIKALGHGALRIRGPPDAGVFLFATMYGSLRGLYTAMT